MKLKSIRGSQKTMTDGHLDEYLYRYNRKREGSVFNLLLEDIAKFLSNLIFKRKFLLETIFCLLKSVQKLLILSKKLCFGNIFVLHVFPCFEINI